MAKPTMAASLSGELNTRAAPKRSRRPEVQRNTPPKATSWPRTMVRASDSMATPMASFTAVNRFLRARRGAGGWEGGAAQRAKGEARTCASAQAVPW